MSNMLPQSNAYSHIIETIRNNIQWLNEYNSNQTKSRRNLLNKWFLDSIKNYFMEQHAAPLLNNLLKLKSTQQVKELIHSKIDNSIPKYMSILKNYFNLLQEHNKVAEFKRNLIEMMSRNLEDCSCSMNQTNYITQKTVRKQFVGLLVLTYCDISNKDEINSFYDLWNIIFPNDKQIKMRLSKYDMIKENDKPQKESSSRRKTKPVIKYDDVPSNSQSQQQFSYNNKQTINYPSPQSSYTLTVNMYNSTTNNTTNLQSSENLNRQIVNFEELNSVHTQSQENLEIFYNQKECENNNKINNNYKQQQYMNSQTNISQINSDFQTENGVSSVVSSSQSEQIIIGQDNNNNNHNNIASFHNICTPVVVAQQIQNNFQNESNIKQNNQNYSTQSMNTNSFEYQPHFISKINQNNIQVNYTATSQQQIQQFNQVTAQNLKQLEIFYQIQNEPEVQQQQQVNGSDYPSSLSVQMNSDPELFSSSSRLDDDCDNNNYIYSNDCHSEDEYVQYPQQQATIDVFANTYDYSKCQNQYIKKEDAVKNPISEVFSSQQQYYQEYPQQIQHINEQYQQYQQYQQYPQYHYDQPENIYYLNQQFQDFQDHKEEYVDNYLTRQYI